MALLVFRQAQLPPGIYHLLLDDGETITHVFAECAPWRLVARAASSGTTEYAATYWMRVPEEPANVA